MTGRPRRGRPTCPGARTTRYRDLTKAEVSDYHRQNGKWPTMSMAVCEVCGTIARASARGYESAKIAMHPIPEDWVACDHYDDEGGKHFPYECKRCGGSGYRPPDVPKADDALPDPPIIPRHSHGNPSLGCTDHHCRHAGERYRHADNCDPDPAVPCPPMMSADEAPELGWYPPGPMANHVNAAPPSMGDVLERDPIVPPSTPLAEEVLPGWIAPGVPDPHIMAAMTVGTLRTQLEGLKLPEQIGGGFHTVADIVRPHLDTIAKQIDVHRSFFATERAMHPVHVLNETDGRTPIDPTNRTHRHHAPGGVEYTHTHRGGTDLGHVHPMLHAKAAALAADTTSSPKEPAPSDPTQGTAHDA